MEESKLVYKLQNDDILYFLHIPKTAGTTFISIIDEHFDYESIFPGQRWDQLLPKLPINFSKYRLVRGHFGYGIRQLLSKKPVYITMLRNPIERCISWYEFVCYNAKSDPTVRPYLFDDSLTLSEILSDPKKKITFENEQVRYLSKEPSTSFSNKQINEQNESIPFCVSLPPIDSSDLETAKRHLLEFPFFGLAERFEDSMFLLCYTFCWRPIHKIASKMVGKNRKISKDLPKEVIDTLVNLNELDTELYNFAQDLFEIRFKKMINELKEKYYEPRYEGMQFKKMIHEMLEKHYEENFNHSQKKCSVIDYNFSEGMSGIGWHPREIDPQGVVTRFTGPEKVSEIDFPLLEKQDYKFQFSVFRFLDKRSLNGLKIKINNQLIKLKPVTGGRIYEGIIPESFLSHEKNFIRITLEIPYITTKNPIDNVKNILDKPFGKKNYFISSDKLPVGVALNRIKILPIIKQSKT